MIELFVEFTDRVWFGDMPSVQECGAQVKSVINVAHNIKRSYWGNVGRLPWDVWYFRLASPDRESLSEEYIQALEWVIRSIDKANKFPLLCHCRMGGHRGPTTALFAT